jgi:hypothetical protein
VQTSQLQHDQEQEEDDGAVGIQQVLPLLSEAYRAQGEQVNLVIWWIGELLNGCRIIRQAANLPSRQFEFWSVGQ